MDTELAAAELAAELAWDDLLAILDDPDPQKFWDWFADAGGKGDWEFDLDDEIGPDWTCDGPAQRDLFEAEMPLPAVLKPC